MTSLIQIVVLHRGGTYNCHAQWAENINLRQKRCGRNIVETFRSSQSVICTLRTTMGRHVGDATNVTPPWRNHTFEFQIMDQNLIRAQEISWSSIFAVGLFPFYIVIGRFVFCRCHGHRRPHCANAGRTRDLCV